MHAIALLIREKENRLLIQFITMLKDNPFFSAMSDANLLIITVAAGPAPLDHEKTMGVNSKVLNSTSCSLSS